MMTLTEIARKAIEKYFSNDKYMPNCSERKKHYDKKACFVTLTIDGKLRGCMGSLIPIKSLWQDIVDNAINSAFNDPRFPPLSKAELNNVKIEVSILSEPKEIKFKNPEELLRKIRKDWGIIIQSRNKSATFLPQVWEQLPKKQQFLEELSLKAGLGKSAWKQSKIYYYTVSVEKE